MARGVEVLGQELPEVHGQLHTLPGLLLVDNLASRLILKRLAFPSPRLVMKSRSSKARGAGGSVPSAEGGGGFNCSANGTILALHGDAQRTCFVMVTSGGDLDRLSRVGPCGTWQVWASSRGTMWNLTGRLCECVETPFPLLDGTREASHPWAGHTHGPGAWPTHRFRITREVTMGS